MLALYLIMYLMAATVTCLYLYGSIRRSEFGVIFSVSESMFLFGCCLYPILYYLGLLIPGIEEGSAIRGGLLPGFWTALHILSLSVSVAIGFNLALKTRPLKPVIVKKLSCSILRDEISVFRLLVSGGIGLYLLFFSIVGYDVALINAVLARSGEFSGFGESQKYMFLKTVASLSLFSHFLIPQVLSRAFRFKFLWLTLYIILILLAYLNSISRTLVIANLFIPPLVYLWTRRSRLKYFFMLVLLPLIGIVVQLGKSFGNFISITLSGGDGQIESYQSSDGLFNSFFRNFGHAWFSVEAGVRSFFDVGPLVNEDILLSIFGFVPARIMDSFGLISFHYTNISDGMACINAAKLGLETCTIPTLYPSFSAYVAPVAGAMFIGLLRGFIFGSIDFAWRNARLTGFNGLWLLWFLAATTSNYLTFIPPTIAQTSFLVLIILFILFFKFIVNFVVAKGRFQGPSATRPS